MNSVERNPAEKSAGFFDRKFLSSKNTPLRMRNRLIEMQLRKNIKKVLTDYCYRCIYNI